jgi:predicted acyl esterase
MRAGAYDQRTGPGLFGARPPYGPLSERPDVLSFATPPLAEDLEVAGPLELHLWVASDGPDADLHAKLVDVYPPNDDYPQGFAMNLSEGLLRLRYRASWEEPAPTRPGEVYAPDRDIPDCQFVPARPSAAARHRRQQFPAFRRQP